MKDCAACSASLPDSSDICELCGHKVGDDVPAPVAVSVAPLDDVDPASTTLPGAAVRSGLSHRELVAGIGAALVVGVLTLGLLVSRGAPSSEVAAAHGAAMSSAAAAAEPVPPPPVDGVKWTAGNVVHWTGRARNTAAFELHAENTVAIWMRNVRPLLVVRCMSNTTEAFVITDSALKIEPQTDDHTVSVRFDNDPEIKERWQDAEDHNAVFAPDAILFTERLTRARMLRFGYTPHNADSVVAVFHVNGLGPLIQPSAKHCGWTK